MITVPSFPRLLFVSCLLGSTAFAATPQSPATSRTGSPKTAKTTQATPSSGEAARPAATANPPAASPSSNIPASDLADIIVTATRTSSNPFEVPYTTNIITEKQLQEYNDRTIPEALEFVPGVSVQKTAHGHGSPYIRGFTGRQNLLMLEGVRLNNSVWRSGPIQYWNTVDPLAIQRMELVKGQGSVLYGSDSVGGALNLFTQQANYQDYPEFGPETVGFLDGNAFFRIDSNSWSPVGRISSDVGLGGIGGLHAGFSAKQYNDIRGPKIGRMKNTGYGEDDWDVRFDYQVSPNTVLTVGSYGLSQDDVWRTHTTTSFESWNGTIPVTNPQSDRHFDQKNTVNFARLQSRDICKWIDSASWTVAVKTFNEVEFLKTPKPTLKPTSIESRWDDTTVNTLGFNMQYVSPLPKGSLTWGGDYYRDWIDSSRRTTKYNTSTQVSTTTTSIQGPVADDSTYDLAGAFAEYLLPLAKDKLEFRLGTRYTYARAHLGQLDVGGKSESATRDWNDWVGSGRLLYRATKDLHFYGGVSQSFRAPNVDDLSAFQKIAQSNNVSYGSTDLKPEKFLTYEVGSMYQRKNWNVAAAWYFTDMSDLITSKLFKNGTSVSSITTNASSGWVTGVELSGAWDFHPQWTLSGVLGWTDGQADEYIKTGSNSFIVSEGAIGKMPPTIGSVALRWTQSERKYFVEGRVTAATDASRLNYSDSQDTSRIPPGGTPGYYIASIYTGIRLSENLNLYVSFENITDQAYRTHGSGVNGPGFNTIASLNYTW